MGRKRKSWLRKLIDKLTPNVKLTPKKKGKTGGRKATKSLQQRNSQKSVRSVLGEFKPARRVGRDSPTVYGVSQEASERSL